MSFIVFNKNKMLVWFFLFFTNIIFQSSASDITASLLGENVIVRVWSSHLMGGENVGHVSLQTSQDYISFWPPGQGGGQRGTFNTLQEDYRDERGRDPEITIALRHPNQLSVNGIHNDFDFLKGLLFLGSLRWDLNSDNQKLKEEFTKDYYDRCVSFCSMPQFERDGHVFGFYKIWSFNCAGLVYNILKNREYVLDNHMFGGRLNSCIAPDQVAAICSVNFQRQIFRLENNERVYDAVETEMRKRRVKFCSWHTPYLGYEVYKSIGGEIRLNQNPLESAIEKISADNDRGFGHSFAAMMIQSGISELLGGFLNPGGRK